MKALQVRDPITAKTLAAVLLAFLAGCAAPPHEAHAVSPCAAGEATYACQVKRYQDVASP